MSFRPILIVFALLHVYLGVRLLPDLPGPAFLAWLGGLGLLASALLVPAAMHAYRIRRQPLSDRITWAGMLALGLFSSLLVLSLLRDVVMLIALATGIGSVGLTRWSAAAVPLLALFISAIGFWNARRVARVVEVQVPIAGLPETLHGFSIVQISDIHVGPTIKRAYLEQIVAAVNRLEADLVAITGDLVDGSVHQLAPHTAPLQALRGRHGVMFVTGNHEYYSNAQAWIPELRRLGLRVLLNEHVVIEREGAQLVVAGVTDYSAHLFDPAHRSDPHVALAGAPSGAAVKLLLAHQPRSALAAARAGFDLQLSGHTHGGQFFPWNFFVPLQQPYVAGLHRLEQLWIYTSRGTGYWGPPKRFGAPSEITRIRLVAGSNIQDAKTSKISK